MLILWILHPLDVLLVVLLDMDSRKALDGLNLTTVLAGIVIGFPKATTFRSDLNTGANVPNDFTLTFFPSATDCFEKFNGV
jgi:hypothetical protein